jgi:hypothetical protein
VKPRYIQEHRPDIGFIHHLARPHLEEFHE